GGRGVGLDGGGGGGGGGQGRGEGGGLRLVEARRRDAKVGAARRVHAPQPGPPLRHAQIQLQDAILRERELEPQRRDRLFELAERVARGREVQVLGELLRDRARSAERVARPVCPPPPGRRHTAEQPPEGRADNP